MNSEKISPARLVSFKFSRQAILDRNLALWGNEIQIHAERDVVSNPQDSIFFRDLQVSAHSEALQHTRPTRSSTKTGTLKTDNNPGLHKLLRIEQSMLLCENTLKEIVTTCEVLEKHRQQLVICVENPLDALPGPEERRALIRQMFSLKDQACIQFAYNNYTIDTKYTDLLLDLGVYDYIKMPFPDAALRLSMNTRSGLFDQIYEHMLKLINSARISFIADSVDHANSSLLARRLPFDYFQGSYYSPADKL